MMLKIFSFLPGRFCTKKGVPLYISVKIIIKRKKKGNIHINSVIDKLKSNNLLKKNLYTATYFNYLTTCYILLTKIPKQTAFRNYYIL